MKLSHLTFKHFRSLLFIVFFWSACSEPTTQIESYPNPKAEREDSTATKNNQENSSIKFQRFPDDPDLDTTQWMDIESLLPSAILDIKYATTDNFTGKVIYDCQACLMRTEAAEALFLVAKEFEDLGYYIKLFDCYRPAPFQQRLWDVVPDPRYVAPPEKGSNHSRGMAIDLTLVEIESGNEVDMGTTYDYFGREAHPGYKNLPDEVLQNRKLLSNIMEMYGFEPITSEWWHFDLKGKRYGVSDFIWNCPNGH